MVELASLAAPAQEVLERLERRRRSAPAYEASAFLAKCGETTVHDLCYFTGATPTLRRLEKQRYHRPPQPRSTASPPPGTVPGGGDLSEPSSSNRPMTPSSARRRRAGVTASAETLVYIPSRRPCSAACRRSFWRICAGNCGALFQLHQPPPSAGAGIWRRGSRSILFLNRRGSSRQLCCVPSAAMFPVSPVQRLPHLPLRQRADDVPLRGHSQPAPDTCPDCGGAMKHIGFGTQKVEEELTRLFPGTELLRMDADTVGEGHESSCGSSSAAASPFCWGLRWWPRDWISPG